jgi:enolase
MIIQSITARKIIASMGDYTVEATIEFDGGQKSVASVPAGISAGKYEVAKVDADTGINQISQISQICSGKDWTQESLDEEIIKHGFGGNATLAVSASFYKANRYSLTANRFPKLMLLLFEGGEHGNKNLTIQEFMVIEDGLEQAFRDFRDIREYLETNNIETTVGVEGGFSPINFTNTDVLDAISKVLPSRKIALDVAGTFAKGEFLDYSKLTHQYNLASIEDPYDDENWSSWSNLTNLLGPTLMIVGDDLVTTNPQRIQKAVELKACNAVIIKPNQIGTITLAKQAVELARKNNFKIIVSHRGQETDDWWIADFAVDVGADYVKFGGMDRGERVAKYNRLAELLPSGSLN